MEACTDGPGRTGKLIEAGQHWAQCLTAPRFDEDELRRDLLKLGIPKDQIEQQVSSRKASLPDDMIIEHENWSAWKMFCRVPPKITREHKTKRIIMSEDCDRVALGIFCQMDGGGLSLVDDVLTIEYAAYGELK